MKFVAQEHALQHMVSVRRLHDLPSQRWHGCFGTSENPTLRCPKLPDVDSKPSRDFQRPPISLDGFVFFEYIVQRFTSRIYQVSSCGLSHASTKLIGHVFQPQFAAHSELDQEHFSSNNAGPCKLIRCTWKLELDPVPRKHTINKLEEPP